MADDIASLVAQLQARGRGDLAAALLGESTSGHTVEGLSPGTPDKPMPSPELCFACNGVIDTRLGQTKAFDPAEGRYVSYHPVCRNLERSAA
jgi:hypothetical protein